MCNGGCLNYHKDTSDNDIESIQLDSLEKCIDACRKHSECQYFAYHMENSEDAANRAHCFLKYNGSGEVSDVTGVVSGPAFCT